MSHNMIPSCQPALGLGISKTWPENGQEWGTAEIGEEWLQVSTFLIANTVKGCSCVIVLICQ